MDWPSYYPVELLRLSLPVLILKQTFRAWGPWSRVRQVLIVDSFPDVSLSTVINIFKGLVLMITCILLTKHLDSPRVVKVHPCEVLFFDLYQFWLGIFLWLRIIPRHLRTGRLCFIVLSSCCVLFCVWSKSPAICWPQLRGGTPVVSMFIHMVILIEGIIPIYE